MLVSFANFQLLTSSVGRLESAAYGLLTPTLSGRPSSQQTLKTTWVYFPKQWTAPLTRTSATFGCVIPASCSFEVRSSTVMGNRVVSFSLHSVWVNRLPSRCSDSHLMDSRTQASLSFDTLQPSFQCRAPLVTPRLVSDLQAFISLTVFWFISSDLQLLFWPWLSQNFQIIIHWICITALQSNATSGKTGTQTKGKIINMWCTASLLHLAKYDSDSSSCLYITVEGWNQYSKWVKLIF